jgi:hypothetical protein
MRSIWLEGIRTDRQICLRGCQGVVDPVVLQQKPALPTERLAAGQQYQALIQLLFSDTNVDMSD